MPTVAFKGLTSIGAALLQADCVVKVAQTDDRVWQPGDSPSTRQWYVAPAVRPPTGRDEDVVVAINREQPFAVKSR